MQRYLFFDLDGTLTDSMPGIVHAVQYALRHFGIEPPADEALRCFVGPPMRDSFMEFYGMGAEEAERAVAVSREYFVPKGMFENELYEGIPELLDATCAAGYANVIATSKPEEFALRIMEHFGLARYMDVIAGAPMDNQEGAKKAAVIRDALRRCGGEDLAGVVMVGDRRHDVAGGHEVGVKVIGVLYGYGDRAEHEAAGADFIAEDIPALRALLLG